MRRVLRPFSRLRWPEWLQPFGEFVWPGTGPAAALRLHWPEWAAIGLAVASYAAGALRWSASSAALGLGAQAFRLPTGQLLSAPLALLNPVLGVPILLVGMSAGARVALLASLLAAALGMWWLMLVLEGGPAVRVWAGLAYAFAGLPVAAVVRGDLGLLLGCAWLPWAAAFGLAACRTRRRLHAAAAAASLALVILSGHAALLRTVAIVSVPVLAVAGCRLRLAPPALIWQRRPVALAGVILLLAGAVAAVQWWPQLAAGLLTVGADPSAGQGVLTSGEVWRAVFSQPVEASSAETLGASPYAYLGPVPWLLLVGLLALRWERERLALYLGGLCVTVLPFVFAGLLSATGMLPGFLALSCAAAIALAGVGADGLWRWSVARLKPGRVAVPVAVRRVVAHLVLVLVALMLVGSAGELYARHRSLLAAGVAESAPLRTIDNIGWPEVLHLYDGPAAPFYKAGGMVSIPSFVALLGLVVGDFRRRRRRIEADAVYADGVLVPSSPLELPDGAKVHLTVTPPGDVAEQEQQTPAAAAQPAAEPDAEAEPLTLPESRIGVAGIRQPARRAEWILFALGLLVYVVTRFWAIERFPIYFFSDEAIQPVLAEELLARNLRDYRSNLLPVYFEVAGNRWTPLLPVYVHALSVGLFGKSILVTRATGAIASILAALAVALALKSVFKAKYWWAGALVMAVAPAWFLHSRTGFETVMMSSFFACFALSYLLYRTRSPRFLYAAVLFGMATFYSYSNGQMIMAAAGLLLALSDVRYHLKHWRTAVLGVVLIAVLAVPVLRFRSTQPESMTTHLRAIGSYWFEDKPLGEKLGQFTRIYASGLSPRYWFFSNERDLARHRMKGYGNLGLPLLPFFLLGVGLCLWKVRSAPHRAVLLMAAATPAGAALLDISITRVLAFTGPATIIVGLGLDGTLGFVERLLAGRAKSRLANAVGWSGFVLPGVVFALLSIASLTMLRDALVNGPTWYRDYTLYGMQYGAKQLFAEAIPETLAEDPDTRLLVSSTWANGTDVFLRFFLSREQQSRVQMLSIDHFMSARRTVSRDMLLVMTAVEYAKAQQSGKFKEVAVEKIIPYPDGNPGFYFARLAYADDFDATLASERADRAVPVVEELALDGQSVQVTHSRFDIGQLRDVFDGDPFTLARGLEANPLVFELVFLQPRKLAGVRAVFGSMDFSLTAKLYVEGVNEPVTYSQAYRGVPPDPEVYLPFDGAPERVSKVRLEILHLTSTSETHIHVRELEFR